MLASTGWGSRRSCEELIAAGRVTVNGDQQPLGSGHDGNEPLRVVALAEDRRQHTFGDQLDESSPARRQVRPLADHVLERHGRDASVLEQAALHVEFGPSGSGEAAGQDGGQDQQRLKLIVTQAVQMGPKISSAIMR